MFFDKQNCFDFARALSGLVVGNNLSTDVMDIGLYGVSPGQDVAVNPANYAVLGTPIPHDPGRGNAPELLVQIGTAAVSATGTLQVQLVQADNAALSTNLEVLAESAALAAATLVSGYQFRFSRLPHGITKRYVGIRYVVGTAVFTAGTIYAALTITRQQNPSV